MNSYALKTPEKREGHGLRGKRRTERAGPEDVPGAYLARGAKKDRTRISAQGCLAGLPTRSRPETPAPRCPGPSSREGVDDRGAPSRRRLSPGCPEAGLP